MDTYPIPARSLERYFKVDGRNLERCYKEVLSGFYDWSQREHSSDWILIEDNIGERMSIDETSFQEDLYTFLSNKDGHGRKGTIAAAVRGTKSKDVIEVLMQIPEETRNQVKEVTMDFSDSMSTIVRAVFPNAVIVLDCFHIIKRSNDGMEEIRLQEKRKAVTERRKEEAAHKKRLKRNAAHRKWYRKTHPKQYKGKRRGPKPKRLNTKFKPTILSNGDTKVELLTRSRYLLTQSREKWSMSQKERAKLLFELYPRIKEAYDLTDALRRVFKEKSYTPGVAGERLHDWYSKVNRSTLREIKSARDTIREKEENVLNYFIDRSTNASAESLNSKMKSFRAQLRGVSDMNFFMFRLSKIFG